MMKETQSMTADTHFKVKQPELVYYGMDGVTFANHDLFSMIENRSNVSQNNTRHCSEMPRWYLWIEMEDSCTPLNGNHNLSWSKSSKIGRHCVCVQLWTTDANEVRDLPNHIDDYGEIDLDYLGSIYNKERNHEAYVVNTKVIRAEIRKCQGDYLRNEIKKNFEYASRCGV